MKLDMDLIRRMLMAWEQDDDEMNSVGGDPSVNAYHFRLLRESPLAERISTKIGGVEYIAYRMTPTARTFLDLARDEDRWDEAKRKVLAATGGLNFDLLHMTLRDLEMRAAKLR